jgi:membrane protease YdiL (CAAX protease family)
MINVIKTSPKQLRRQTLSYFKRAKSYSSIRFIIEIVLLDFLLKIILALFLSSLIDGDGISNTEQFAQHGISSLFIIGVILVPAIETLIGQWLPIQVVSLFSHHPATLISVSALFFASLHLSWDLATFFAVLPGGVLLAWSFVLKRKKSFWHAYWITTAIHSLHNFIAACMFLAVRHFNLI